MTFSERKNEEAVDVIVIPAVNLFAVVVAAVAGFVVGGIYWAIFGNSWKGLMVTFLSKKPEEIKFTGPAFAVAFITRLITAYVLAIFINLVGAKSALDGAEIGFLAWLGFWIMIFTGFSMFERRPWKLYAVGVPVVLIDFVVAGAIIGAWM